MIFYFSGTGNSQLIAKRIAKRTGRDLCRINDFLKRGEKLTIPDSIAKLEDIVFVMPVYGWRIPRAVEELIRRSALEEGTGVYFVLTCGSDMGNSQRYAEKLCADMKLKYKGCAELVMPENYIAMFDAPEEAEARRIIELALPQADRLAGYIERQEDFPEKRAGLMARIKSTVINPLFYKFSVKDRKFNADDRCTGCGRCAAECPVNDILMNEGKPVWQGRCIHCMACITGCPEEAIEYGTISLGKPRYRCPDMSRTEEKGNGEV